MPLYSAPSCLKICLNDAIFIKFTHVLDATAKSLRRETSQRRQPEIILAVISLSLAVADVNRRRILRRLERDFRCALDCEQSLFGQSRLSSAGLERANSRERGKRECEASESRGEAGGEGGKGRRDCILFSTRRVQVTPPTKGDNRLKVN